MAPKDRFPTSVALWPFRPLLPRAVGARGGKLKFKFSISYTFQSELISSNDDLFLFPIITIVTIIVIIKANSCDEV